MIGKKVETAFNDQLKRELESFYLYLSMTAWFHSVNLDGMANWMRIQSQEEMGHAMRLFDHIYKRNGEVELSALVRPKAKWASALDAFREAYGHEQFITNHINGLMQVAESEGDNAGRSFLQWFVDEQVEEEATSLGIVKLLERIGESRSALIMLDFKLSGRQAGGPGDIAADFVR